MKKILIMFIFIFLSCSSEKKEISFKTVSVENNFQTSYETEIFFGKKLAKTVSGNSNLQLLNKDKTKAVINCLYYEKNSHQVDDVWLIKTEGKVINKIFSDKPVALYADEELDNLLVVYYEPNEKTNFIRVLIYDVNKQIVKKEKQIQAVTNDYSLNKVKYSNKSFVFNFINDIEETRFYSLSVE